MARILSLDECTVGLRNALLTSLRSLDEAVLLPQATRRSDSGVYKNIIFRLVGNEGAVPYSIFSPSWFTGVSAVKVEAKFATGILVDPVKRKAVLAKLREAIPSEMADSELQVGPSLDCDKDDCDNATWIAGFDSPGCFVGLYSCEHSSAPDTQRRGMNRVHQTSYLVCKAGAGLAGSTFHSRLTAALKKGRTLDECFDAGGDLGPAALRRVSMAGSRNRARILMLAGEALGLHLLDTVPDQSSRGKYRCAVTHVDVNVNVLRKIDDAATSLYQYSTALDAAASQGLLSMSNASDGVVLMLSPNGEVRQTLRNDAYSTLPFSSMRIVSDRDLISKVVAEHKEAKKHDDAAHPDDAYIKDRFCWKNRVFGSNDNVASQPDLEPLALWGNYEHEDYIHKFARELGIATCQIVRLRPAAVCMAGIDAGKLRAAMRNLQGGGK